MQNSSKLYYYLDVQKSREPTLDIFKAATALAGSELDQTLAKSLGDFQHNMHAEVQEDPTTLRRQEKGGI